MARITSNVIVVEVPEQVPGPSSIIDSVAVLPASETTVSYEVRLVNLALPLTATCSVRFREQGTSTWFDAASSYRIRPDWTNTTLARSEGFAGMVFFLQPGKTYDIEVTVSDGVSFEVLVVSMTTRASPRANPVTPTVVSVGSTAQLVSAISGASPGDVIELSNGTYDGTGISTTVDGTFDQPIIVRGASRDSVVISYNASQFSASMFRIFNNHWTFERLTIDNTNSAGYALHAKGAENLTVRRCRLKGRGGIDGRQQGALFNKDWSIHDNLLEGQKTFAQIVVAIDADDTSTLYGGEGLADIQGSGHEIYQNTLSGFGDTLGVSNPFQFTIDGVIAQMNRGIVIRNNHVLYGGDDAVEFDDAYSHVAAYQNLIVGTANMLSVQPNTSGGMHGGPRYFFQNIGIGMHGGSSGPGNTDVLFKFKKAGSGLDTIQPGFVCNNTVYLTEGGQGNWCNVTEFSGDVFSNWWFLNNVIYATVARATGIQFVNISGEWWWIDRNAYGIVSGPSVINHGSFGSASDIAAFAALGFSTPGPFDISRPVEQSSVAVAAADIDASAVTMAATWRTLATGGDIFPSAGSALIGSGVSLPQLSQNGSSDMGARDRASAAPLYGNQYSPLNDTVIGLAAPALGTSVAFPAGAMPDPMWVNAVGSPITTWNTRFHFFDDKLYVLGKGEGGDPLHHTVYDLQTNIWTELSETFGANFGHVYDGFAIDPATGDQYYSKWDGNIAKYTVGGAWANFSTGGPSGQGVGLCYHENFNGPGQDALLACGDFGIRSLDVTSLVWTDLTGDAFANSFGAQAHYDQVTQRSYMGGGDSSFGGNSANLLQIVSSGGAVVTNASMPVTELGGGEETGSLGAAIYQSPYGTSTLYMLEFESGTQYWTSSDNGASWILRGNHPFPATGECAAGVIVPLNLFWFMWRENFSPSDFGSILWTPPNW